MMHHYKNALDTMRKHDDFDDEVTAWVSNNYKTIRKALELAIALQPKPISEAAIDGDYLVYMPERNLDKYSVQNWRKTENSFSNDMGITHFYDIRALPEPEAGND